MPEQKTHRTMLNLLHFKKLSQSRAPENKKFITRLKRKPPRDLDGMFLDAHEKVFENTDCLECANCCKTTSPIITSQDLERLARLQRLRPADFIDTYLRMDEEGDYVFKMAPCPFLQENNHCSVYEHRPKACREYPHTNRRKMSQILSLTYQNSLVCPAVLEILEQIKKQIK